MKYTNLVDAVTGIIYEGKSYKRNKDEDSDAKKAKDQERKDAAKNKKQPVEEGARKAKSPEYEAQYNVVKTLKRELKDAFGGPGKERTAIQTKLDAAEKKLKELDPVSEGKSYKRNKDEDVDAKKKEDKQKRDNKKPVAEAVDPIQRRKTLRNLIKKTKDLEIEHSDKPSKQAFYEKLTARYQEELDSLKGKKVAEDMRPSEVNPASGSPLKAGGRTLGHSLQPGIMFRVATGPLSKKDLYCARVKDIEGIKWVYVIDAHGDQDWHKADDIAPMKITMRKADDSSKARFTSMGESVFENDEDHDASLEEAYGRGWAILPATVALYGKKVVDIKTAASEWASDSHPTTILVCSKHQDGRNRMLFLSSSGDCRTQYKVGQASETYHDQTGASKGVYTVENVVVFQGGEIVYQVNNKGMTGKASVAVFK